MWGVEGTIVHLITDVVRYVNEHARQHYKETMHAYALELQTSRVWDYVGDGYVISLFHATKLLTMIKLCTQIGSKQE
jgi:hypothetical protein